MRPKRINSLPNLMLLCPTCHKEVDDHPDKYPRRLLESVKQAHEKHIALVTAAGPDRKTKVVQFKAKIGGKDVAIPAPHVFEAVAPRYPEEETLIIDLSTLDDRQPPSPRPRRARSTARSNRCLLRACKVSFPPHLAVRLRADSAADSPRLEAE